MKKEEELQEERSSASVPGLAIPKKSFALPRIPWKEIITAGLIVIIAWLIWMIWPKIQSSVQSFQNKKSSTAIAQSKPNDKPRPGAQPIRPEAEGPKTASAVEPGDSEDLEVLNRRLSFDPKRDPDPDESKILSNRAVFRTGIIEKLPYQAWTLEQFKKMVSEQEKFFKVPLPRSYKGKLEDLFSQKYLPGAQAFESGDLLKARNDWVESLAFPLYSQDFQRHRGVALTMMRPFINDTLSKIGVINSTLIEQRVRAKEIEVAKLYEEIFGAIDKKDWEAGLLIIDNLSRYFDELETPERLSGEVPPYPAAFSKIDPDIQATLTGIQQSAVPAVSDLDPVRRDVELKRLVLESFIPEKLEAALSFHTEALADIAAQKWQDAEKKLRQIQFPIALVKDAQEKVKILKRLQNPPLDPQSESR